MYFIRSPAARIYITETSQLSQEESKENPISLQNKVDKRGTWSLAIWWSQGLWQRWGQRDLQILNIILLVTNNAVEHMLGTYSIAWHVERAQTNVQ